jgi:large subunit ribosomal protein L10
MMNRKQKEQLVENVRNEFAQAEAAFLVSVKGLSVDQVQRLNKSIRHCGGRMRVIKNTLLAKAIEDMQFAQELSPFFKNQIAVVFAPQNSPAIAQELRKVAKANDKVAILAGKYDQSFMGAARIDFLATLPPKEVVLARFAGALQGPIAKHASVLNELIARLARTIKAVEEKQASQAS